MIQKTAILGLEKGDEGTIIGQFEATKESLKHKQWVKQKKRQACDSGERVWPNFIFMCR